MKAAPIFYLWYDGNSGRYMRHDYGLHCGDGVEAIIDGARVQTRVEHSSFRVHSHGWFLVTHPQLPLEGLPVNGGRL